MLQCTDAAAAYVKNTRKVKVQIRHMNCIYAYMMCAKSATGKKKVVLLVGISF